MMDKAGLTDAMIKQRTGHSKKSSALDIYKDPRVDDVFIGTQKALALQPEPELPQPSKPQRKDNIDIRIKELELELMKLKEKQEKKEQDKLNYLG